MASPGSAGRMCSDRMARAAASGRQGAAQRRTAPPQAGTRTVPGSGPVRTGTQLRQPESRAALTVTGSVMSRPISITGEARPPSSTQTRGQPRQTSPRSWDTHTTGPGNWASRSWSSSSSCHFRWLSRAEKGSSSKMTSGWEARMRPRATRCCWPPESWPGRFFSWPSRRSRRMSRGTSSRRWALSRTPTAMFCSTVMLGKRAYCWKR